MADNLKKNKILVIPKVLEDLARIRERLVGTDRDDHVEEVEHANDRATTALLRLSALENEGVKQLVKAATDELKDIYVAIADKPYIGKQGSAADATRYAFELQCLHYQKDLWTWFLTFFVEAKQSKAEIEKFVADQEVPDLYADE